MVYEYKALGDPASSPQQRLIDRIARRNWHPCAVETTSRCARCGAPLCGEHMHEATQRCRACEAEYSRRHQRLRVGALAVHVALMVGVGVAASALGHRLGLILALPLISATPLIAVLTRKRRARRRFLRERIALPEARARSLP